MILEILFLFFYFSSALVYADRLAHRVLPYPPHYQSRPCHFIIVLLSTGTQDAASYQSAIAAMLGVPISTVTVRCLRAGGAFGAKITRGLSVASASALAATVSKSAATIRCSLFAVVDHALLQCWGEGRCYICNVTSAKDKFLTTSESIFTQSSR